MKSKIWIFVAMLVFISSCANEGNKTEKKPLIMGTTTIVADVVQNIAPESLPVMAILPVGANPHNYEPTPQDMAKVSAAELIFINGLELEGFLEDLLRNSGSKATIIDLSQGIEGRDFSEKLALMAAKGTKQIKHDHTEHDHNHGPADPHVWFDPHNVKIWTVSIAKILIEYSPEKRQEIEKRRAMYLQRLDSLDAWIQNAIANIPQEHRRLVTDHVMFGYFADRYDFIQAGAVIPGYNTLAEPSAVELARLQRTIRDYNISAIFVGNTVNPVLSRQLAQDTGTRLLTFFTGSLGEKGSGAEDYISYMKTNISIIVEGLSGKGN
jgi:manganese/iron transport system substrate-binding protein